MRKKPALSLAGGGRRRWKGERCRLHPTHERTASKQKLNGSGLAIGVLLWFWDVYGVFFFSFVSFFSPRVVLHVDRESVCLFSFALPIFFSARCVFRFNNVIYFLRAKKPKAAADAPRIVFQPFLAFSSFPTLSPSLSRYISLLRWFMISSSFLEMRV